MGACGARDRVLIEHTVCVVCAYMREMCARHTLDIAHNYCSVARLRFSWFISFRRFSFYFFLRSFVAVVVVEMLYLRFELFD